MATGFSRKVMLASTRARVNVLNSAGAAPPPPRPADSGRARRGSVARRRRRVEGASLELEPCAGARRRPPSFRRRGARLSRLGHSGAEDRRRQPDGVQRAKGRPQPERRLARHVPSARRLRHHQRAALGRGAHLHRDVPRPDAEGEPRRHHRHEVRQPAPAGDEPPLPRFPRLARGPRRQRAAHDRPRRDDEEGQAEEVGANRRAHPGRPRAGPLLVPPAPPRARRRAGLSGTRRDDRRRRRPTQLPRSSTTSSGERWRCKRSASGTTAT